MASKYLDIVAEVKAQMDSIEDIGIVHDCERWAGDWQKFLAFFAFTPSEGVQQIRGWEITRRAAPEHQRGAHFRHHIFILQGYMAWKDADGTDKIFQVLVDLVCEAFRNAQAQENATWWYSDGDKPQNAAAQAEIIEPRTFGGVLCHYAQIVLHVTERII